MRSNRLSLLPALLVTITVLPALAETRAGNADLMDCTKLAETRPADGIAKADSWFAAGGGDPARLCRALALFHKGEFKPAGALFADLSASLGKNDGKTAAALLARAGWSLLRAGDAVEADRLYTQALERSPDDPDLRIDRAFARAEAGRYDDAVADLDQAISGAPDRADAYLYRAAANKARKETVRAMADVEEALKRAPKNPEALLLRGNLKAGAGDIPAAKADWQAVQRVAPGSKQAAAARANLDRLAEAEKPAAPAKEPAKK